MTSPVQLWVPVQTVSDYLGADAPAADDTVGQAMLLAQTQAATELLYALSGRQFPGVLTAYARPTARPEQVTDVVWSHTLRYLGYGGSYNSSWLWGICVGCGNTGCGGPYMIGLGRSPLISIEEIQINGDILDPSEYRIDDAKWLVRVGSAGWPTCQNLAAPLGDDATFGVSFTFGQNPPQLGMNACTLLASELYRGATPSLAATCSLPRRVTSVTRQGVSISILDSMQYVKDGYTGVPSIDMFITAYNPGNSVRRPMVFSPDLVNTARRETWPGM
jgi:hypothetical protein